mgnify:CR=1 FL=1
MAGTGGVGSVTVQGKANYTVTGVAGTGAVGTTTYIFGYPVTGVVGTGAVGTVSVNQAFAVTGVSCLLYTSPSPRDKRQWRIPWCA